MRVVRPCQWSTCNLAQSRVARPRGSDEESSRSRALYATRIKVKMRPNYPLIGARRSLHTRIGALEFAQVVQLVIRVFVVPLKRNTKLSNRLSMSPNPGVRLPNVTVPM